MNPESALKQKGFLSRKELSAERKDARFERLFRRLDERHERTTALYAIEQYLRELPIQYMAQRAARELSVYLQRLPPDTQTIIQEGISQFLEIREEGKRYYFELEREIEEKYEGLSSMITPELVGETFFERATGKGPKGEVFFGYREGCFVVRFALQEDQNIFAKINCLTEKDEDTHQGRFIPEFCIQLTNGTLASLPLVMIGSHNDPDEEAGTLLHERQHFTYEIVVNLLPRMELHENPSLKKQSEILQRRVIKDELLAFAREGIMGTEFINDRLPQYQQDFSLPPEEEAADIAQRSTTKGRLSKGMNRDIRAIAKAMGKSFLNRLGPRGWALLVYHLSDIPLERFPEWISLLNMYYREREIRLYHSLKQIQKRASEPGIRKRIATLKRALRLKIPPYEEVLLGLGSDGVPVNSHTLLEKSLVSQKTS